MPDVYKLQQYRGGWAICLYRDGQRISRVRLSATGRAAAQREFNALVAEVARPQVLNVRALWELYREDRAGRPIAEDMEFTGRAILPHFGDMMPEAVEIRHCRAYTAARRAKGRHDGAIWTELGHLRTVMVWAVAHQHISKAPSIERPAKPAPKDYYLTKDQIASCHEAAALPHVRLFLILAMATAGRKQALFDLTWDRVDFAAGKIDLRVYDEDRPTKRRAEVPMNAQLRAALMEAREGALSEYVIEWAGRKVGSVRTALDRIAAKVGLEKLTPHMLRHSAAVWMAMDGVAMQKISQFLGHSDTRITERVYARYRPEHLTDAAEALTIPMRMRVVR
jgi:integrase